jgi:hypothetical protein
MKSVALRGHLRKNANTSLSHKSLPSFIDAWAFEDGTRRNINQHWIRPPNPLTTHPVLLKATQFFQVHIITNMSSDPIEIISEALGSLSAILWGEMAVGNLGVGLVCEVGKVS